MQPGQKSGNRIEAHRIVFFASPIGSEDSESRRRSDLVNRNILEPAVLAAFKSDQEISRPRLVRADFVFVPGSRLDEIIRHVRYAHAVVVDVTDANPNVFYELGLGHAFCRPTILLKHKSEPTRIPFDVAPQSCVSYGLDTARELDQAVNELVGHLRNLSGWRSPVRIALKRKRDLRLDEPTTHESPAESGSLRSLVDELDKLHDEMFRNVEAVDEVTATMKSEWQRSARALTDQIRDQSPSRLRIKRPDDNL